MLGEERPPEARENRLIHHTVGHLVITCTDEPCNHRRRTQCHHAKDVAHEPQRVDHQRHRGYVGFAGQEIARQPKIGETDKHVQHLLDEHG